MSRGPWPIRPKAKRDAALLREFKEGASASKLAKRYGIARQRVYQIVWTWRERRHA